MRNKANDPKGNKTVKFQKELEIRDMLKIRGGTEPGQIIHQNRNYNHYASLRRRLKADCGNRSLKGELGEANLARLLRSISFRSQ